MPYTPYQYQDAQAAESKRRLIDYQLNQAQEQEQAVNPLREIYAQGKRPTIEQIGAYSPELALKQQDSESLQAQRDFEAQLKKQQALKGIMTRFRDVALQQGYNPNDPSTQPVLESLRSHFEPYIESVIGQKVSSEPVSWQHVIAMSDMTPGEQRQQEIQGKLQEQQALVPGQLSLEEQKNQLELEKQGQLYGMQVNRDKEIEGYKANLNVDKEQNKLDQQADRDYVAATSAIDEALPLLKVATQSGIGKNIDAAMAYFGKTTEGADAAAALKTIGARLVGFQPKMSGPQSDKDAQLYREMSGQIGDDSLPMPRRVKALQVVKNLMDAQAQYRGSEVRGKPINDAYTGSWGNEQSHGAPIVQVSPSTGKRRISYDGGNTWQVQ